MQAMLRAAGTVVGAGQETVQRKRELVADLCRLLGRRMQEKTTPPMGQSVAPALKPISALSPRMKQTLELLLAGDSEKQIANQLELSKHTVHVYVKALYRGFDVSSRGELLSRFVSTPVGLSEKLQ